jgi:hypothetical protein
MSSCGPRKRADVNNKVSNITVQLELLEKFSTSLTMFHIKPPVRVSHEQNEVRARNDCKCFISAETQSALTNHHILMVVKQHACPHSPTHTYQPTLGPPPTSILERAMAPARTHNTTSQLGNSLHASRLSRVHNSGGEGEEGAYVELLSTRNKHKTNKQTMIPQRGTASQRRILMGQNLNDGRNHDGVFRDVRQTMSDFFTAYALA